MRSLFLVTFLLINLLIGQAFGISQIPRQNIILKGKIKEKGIKAKFKVTYLESFKEKKQVSVYDPYQNNNKYRFEGISLEDLFKLFAPESKRVHVKAINLYKITIDRNHVDAKDTFFVFKQNGEYIPVDNMGPLRIVRTGKGKITAKNLALEGVDWVWMVKELEFE